MLWCQGAQNIAYPIINLIRAKVHRLITMHARPRQLVWTDRRTRTSYEHRGNSATILSNQRIALRNLYDHGL